ncbi:MAG: alpha/beta fold hydrolase [Christensenellaceae bacterium]
MKINNLNAVVKGKGKTLLLLHGYLCSKEIFTSQIEYFSRFFKVVAIDFTGFGGQKMPYPYSLEDYKKSLLGVINELNDDKIYCLAHSFGARVLLKALPECDKVDKVVLTGPAGLRPKKKLKTRLKIAWYKFSKNVLKRKMENLGSKDYQSLDCVMKESFKTIVNEHLDKKLGEIENQVLIIEGSEDKETPLYMAKRLNKLLKNSTLIVMNGCGHFAFLDKSQYFNILVKEFLLNDISRKY